MSRGEVPAYPVADKSYEDRNGYTIHETMGGMTLREHFAGLAMAAVLSSLTSDSDPVTPREVARCAVANADALIAALESRP